MKNNRVVDEYQELINKVDNQNHFINQKRPLTTNEANQLKDFFKIENTYSSNAIEGNSLTLTETKVLLEDGLTVGGKPIKDYYEATGHAKAYDFMYVLAIKQLLVTEDDVKELHRLFYSGIDVDNAGKYKTEQNIITGTDYVPPTPEETPTLMKQYIADYNELSKKNHPIEIAAFAHQGLVDIHPFVDGNGRTARLVMNLELIKGGYLPVSVPPILRDSYINALKAGRQGRRYNKEPLSTFIAELEYETQKDFIRMFRIDMRGEII
jgi:Fic family protein